MSDETPRRMGLYPGSPLPQNPTEVDSVLRLVPEVAFVPELEGCLFDPSTLPVVTLAEAPLQISKLAGAAYLRKLSAALDELAARAEREEDGGTRFLALALRHFVGSIPTGQHPLIVALWCRSASRRRGEGDVPGGIAAMMDDYESTNGSAL